MSESKDDLQPCNYREPFRSAPLPDASRGIHPTEKDKWWMTYGGPPKAGSRMLITAARKNPPSPESESSNDGEL